MHCRHAIADLELVVSELVSNAVEHGCGTIRLDVEHNGHDLHGFVTDGAPASTMSPPIADTDGPRGRGLTIVDALVTRWGIRDGRNTRLVRHRLCSGRHAVVPTDTRLGSATRKK